LTIFDSSLVVVVGVLYAQVALDGCVSAFVFGQGCFLVFVGLL
jgi:hypothetical protein